MAVLALVAGCITKQPQNLTPIPTNPEMAKLERELSLRVNGPPLPPMPSVIAKAQPKMLLAAKANNAPTFTLVPTNTIVVPGSNTTFRATATGTGTLKYQWSFGGVNIARATNNVYTATNVRTAGFYTVTVTNTYGAASVWAYAAVGTTNILPNCIPPKPKSSVTLAWCPSVSTNGIAGYKVYYGSTNPPVAGWTADIYDTNQPPCPGVILTHGTNWYRAYTNMVDAGTNLVATVTNLASGVTYYFSATAYDTNTPPLESDYSDEVSLSITNPVVGPPTNAVLGILGINQTTVLLSAKVCSVSRVTVQYKNSLTAGSWSVLVANSVPDIYGNFFYYDPINGNNSRFYRLLLQ